MTNPVRIGSTAVAAVVVAGLCGSGDAFVVGGGGAVAPWRTAAHTGTTVSDPSYGLVNPLVWLSRWVRFCPHVMRFVCSQRVVVWEVQQEGKNRLIMCTHPGVHHDRTSLVGHGGGVDSQVAAVAFACHPSLAVGLLALAMGAVPTPVPLCCCSVG